MDGQGSEPTQVLDGQAGGAWLFAERNLTVDWTETRPSPP
jgi:hypothetical protein